MIILDFSTKLQIVLAGAHTSSDPGIVVSYAEETATTKTFGIQASTTNGTTPVDILAAPTSSPTTWRFVKSIQIENSDTGAITISFRTNIGGTTKNFFVVTLQVGDTCNYEDGTGWTVLDSNGQQKSTVLLPGRLIRSSQVLTSGTAYQIPVGCTAIEVELWGAGGGGGGTQSNGAGKISVGGGGASGGYLRKYIAAPQQNSISYAIGAAASGGSPAGGAAGTGGDTTITVNSVTYTAKGGLGGVTGALANSTPLSVLGGAGQLPTNGDLNVQGFPGSPSTRISGTIAVSGAGGNSYIGDGGGVKIANASGSNAAGKAGGGGGGYNTNSATSGGASSAGLIIIREYY